MPSQVVQAGPTKRFFVEMLTRDIELEDAVLDLLDNCIDGILRTKAEANDASGRPYDGYWAEVSATPAGFVIRDNCGGIPVDIATRSAFMFGRPDERDDNIKTVGMYGIGMKRAIFKMGGDATVTSQPESGPYVVEISSEWLKDDDSWELSLEEIDTRLDENGTVVTVTDLFPGIAHRFDPDRSSFLADLRQEISRLYALILEKGFSVSLNGVQIDPVEIDLMAPDDWSTDEPSIRPYLFEGRIDEVDVELAVGFYRTLASEQELELEAESPRASSHKAGWTVICNDRVVLYGDRSLVTGWGQGTVPRFHNQFLAIAGVVVFESTNSLKLPLNTTKRGLDTSSDVYLTVLHYMQEGAKVFTSFTNQWKARENEVATAFNETQRQKVGDLSAKVAEDGWSDVRRIRDEGGSAKKFTPNLPKPEDRRPNRRITFSRTVDDIQLVSEHLFGDPEVPPKEVGERSFDAMLAQAKGENE